MNEPHIQAGDRIVYQNANGTRSTGVAVKRVRKPGMSDLMCWQVDWDDIGIGVAPVDQRASLAETSPV